MNEDSELKVLPTINIQLLFTVGTLLVGLAFWVGSSAMQISHLATELEKSKESLEEFRREKLASDQLTNDRISGLQIEVAKLNINIALVLERLK